MKNVVALVGHSGSGKTRLIVRLVGLLVGKGYRVGVLKHTHARIKVDRQGTDTDRFRRAGAAISVIADDRMMARFENEAEALRLIASLASEVDILIVEGYKKLNLPKVLLSPDLKSGGTNGILATYGPKRGSRDFKLYFLPGQEAKMAAWMIRTFIRPQDGPKVHLIVDGKSLAIKDYVAKTIAGVVAGLVRPLKGGRGRRVSISIDFGKKI